MSRLAVIGGGPNGLSIAACLAKAGHEVDLFERRSELGGLAGDYEFHPGFKVPGLLWDTSLLNENLFKHLELQQHGLRWRSQPAECLLMGEGDHFLLSGDLNQQPEAYVKWQYSLQSYRQALKSLFNTFPADLVDPKGRDFWSLAKHALKLRGLGEKKMLELLRIAPMAVRDYLDEHFDHELLKSSIALSALVGTVTGPRAPGTTASLLLKQLQAGSGVEGDGRALVQALVKAAQQNGVTIHTGTAVQEILPGEGLLLENGEHFSSEQVIASCDPKTAMLNLLNPKHLSHTLSQRLSNYRCRGSSAQFLCAIEGDIHFPQQNQALAQAQILYSMTGLEKAFDAFKYGQVPDQPPMELYIPTIDHLDCAPAGHHVLSVMVHGVPYDLKNGWDQKQKDQCSQQFLKQLESHIPGLSKQVINHQFLSPQDIEDIYGTSGGHLYHGEHALDQLLIRPTPECAQYQTPVPGLTLCSSGTFPGGGLSCNAAHLAMQNFETFKQS